MALLHDRPSEDGFTLAVLLAWGQFLSHFILENALLLALLFTFGGDFLTAFLGSRAKDRCLKHFHGYRVNIEENDNRTCEHAEVPHISLYEGTKHSFATDAIRRGVPERVLQRMTQPEISGPDRKW
jgi:hypothetical protein